MTSSHEPQVGATEFADVAQLVEHSLGKGEVISSILIIGSRLVVCELRGCYDRFMAHREVGD